MRPSTSRLMATLIKRRLVSVVPSVSRVRVGTRKVDTVLKVVNAGTRDAMTISKPVVHRAVNVVRRAATINKVMLKAHRRDTRAEMELVTDKAVLADEPVMDKALLRIADDRTKISGTISRADTRNSSSRADTRSKEDTHRDRLKEGRGEIVVRRAAIKTIKCRNRLTRNRPTMTSAVDVAAW